MGTGKACTTCGGSGGAYELGVCRCCELIDGNKLPRLVKFCQVCGVYLCRQCFKKPLRRIKAFGLDVLASLTE